MKNRIKMFGLNFVLCTIVLASTLVGCNVYDDVYIEVVRTPQIEVDTIIIPDWEDINDKKAKL